MGSGLLETHPAATRRGAWDDAGPTVPVGDIPDIVIRRLPIYVRTLKSLCDRNVTSASSEQLAEMIGVTAAQIRRDLSYFGKFGKQGKGYDTEMLVGAISGILKLDRQWPVVLAGLGNLGRAIANYRGFTPSSFRIAALFDRNPTQVGQQVGEVVEFHAVERGDELLGRHAADQVVADGFRHLDEDFAFGFRLEQLPDECTLVAGERFEKVADLGRVQAVQHQARGTHPARVQVFAEPGQVAVLFFRGLRGHGSPGIRRRRLCAAGCAAR